jgi:pyruvate carboxylase
VLGYSVTGVQTCALPILFLAPERRDRATRMLTFLGDVIVNGNPEVKGRIRPAAAPPPRLPRLPLAAPPAGTKQKLEELGPELFAGWMLQQERVLITDTTMRDAHQSLLATRMRGGDMLAVAPHYAAWLPQLFSVECWGGATFDVAMRFLKEDPWERLALLRQAMPNLLLQMLLRSANAVGYANYPDNVVRYFVQQAAAAGIDVFRVFDSLNWVDNMRVAIDAVRDSGRLCEAAICYTGNLSNPHERKYTLDYYVRLARELKAAGTHILGIKDMAGLCQPRAAYELVKALKDATGLPVHFHTHDTSGIAAASVFAAISAGADAVDAAMDAFSGRPRSRISVRSSRRCASRRAIRGWTARACARSRITGSRCARCTAPSRATSARAPPMCTCTPCRAASTRTCASRRARSASRMRAGRRSRAPTRR